jgi:hypothetical protein
VQKPFDVSLIGQSPLFGEFLGGLNVYDGHPDGQVMTSGCTGQALTKQIFPLRSVTTKVSSLCFA